MSDCTAEPDIQTCVCVYPAAGNASMDVVTFPGSCSLDCCTRGVLCAAHQAPVHRKFVGLISINATLPAFNNITTIQDKLGFTA